MTKFFPIGFHLGIGGNAQGIKENFMYKLDAAGIRFSIKSIGEYGICADAIALSRASGLGHTVFYRVDQTLDVPDYNKSPRDAAIQHWNAVVAKLPNNFDKEVWLEVINEVDKNRSSWLGYFGVEIANLALAQGYKVALFGWSSGEPEPEHWKSQGMSTFLRLAAANRSRLAVALHEYSYTISDIKHQYPWLVGRYKFLFQACDEMGIGRPTVAITEWGWEYRNVPDVAPAIEDIAEIAAEYMQHPEIIGVHLWYLGGFFGDIHNRAQKLIQPTGELAVNFDYSNQPPGNGGPGPEPPPSQECIELNANTRTHVLRPKAMTPERLKWLYGEDGNGGAMGDGVTINGQKRQIGYAGWTHTDSMSAILDAVQAGFTNSILVILDGHDIGTGLDEEWMAENCPVLAEHTVWITTTKEGFYFTNWPTQFEKVNQYWGANPQNYTPFGLPGHDGVDIRALYGTEIYAVADGVVSSIHTNPDTHNYGIHVRIDHEFGYQTIYAHFKEVASDISVGDSVNGGDLIGLSNNTGNSYGSHLHFGLKRFGYGPYVDEISGPEGWPYNLYDPTPFLAELCPTCFEQAPPIPPDPSPTGQSRLGVHASSDPGLAGGEVQAFVDARAEIVKVLSNLPPGDVTSLTAAVPNAPLVIRAFLSFHGRTQPVTPRQFCDWTLPDVRRTIISTSARSSAVGRAVASLRLALASDISLAEQAKHAIELATLAGKDIFVELHNEPNLRDEGLWVSWQDGTGFSAWLRQVIDIYRNELPGVKLLYPGLSPGGNVSGIRQDSSVFIAQSSAAASLCDGVGVHTYWASNWPMQLAIDVVDMYISKFPGKPIIITEASNNKGTTDADRKAAEYIAFNERMKERPSVYGVTYFIMSSSNPAWGWGTGGSGEAWLGTSIPVIVGNRQ